MKKPFQFISNHPLELINNAVMLEVECSKLVGSFCTDMGVTGFPTVVLVYKGKLMAYPGARSHAAMTEFLGNESNWLLEDLPIKIAKHMASSTTTPISTNLNPPAPEAGPTPPAIFRNGPNEL
jgi:hypothetical protein